MLRRNAEQETDVLAGNSKLEKHDQAVIKRSGRKHEAESHGGAWKVAFADFCLALMCLFLVLWVMAARQKEEVQAANNEAAKSSQMNEGQGIKPEISGGPRGSLIDRLPVQSAIERMKNGEKDAKNEQASKVHYESTSDLQALARVLASLSADAGLSSNLQSIVTPFGLRVMLHDTDNQGMFERGSAVPTTRFKNLLRKLGPLFAQMNNQILIVGHTDSSQYADRGHAAFSNWTLSSNRAMTARSHLLAGHMSADSILQVVGMADRAPLDIKDPAASVNRRIELLILTSAQAESIAAMFGVPGESTRLIDDVNVVLPDRDTLKKLRDKLIPVKGSSARAN